MRVEHRARIRNRLRAPIDEASTYGLRYTVALISLGHKAIQGLTVN